MKFFKKLIDDFINKVTPVELKVLNKDFYFFDTDDNAIDTSYYTFIEFKGEYCYVYQTNDLKMEFNAERKVVNRQKYLSQHNWIFDCLKRENKIQEKEDILEKIKVFKESKRYKDKPVIDFIDFVESFVSTNHQVELFNESFGKKIKNKKTLKM